MLNSFPHFQNLTILKPTSADSPLFCLLLHFKSIGLNINQSVFYSMFVQCFLCLFLQKKMLFRVGSQSKPSRALFQECPDHVHTCTHSHLEDARCYKVDLLAIEQVH